VLHPKKVGTLPVEGQEEVKQTNEIGMFTQVLDEIDIAGRDITVLSNSGMSLKGCQAGRVWEVG
jgi:hypothetical protein